MLNPSSGIGKPLFGLPVTTVWKLTVTSPAGRSRLPEPGIGTSPYALYLSNTNAFRIITAANPMIDTISVKMATTTAIRGPNLLMGEVCHASVCAAAPMSQVTSPTAGIAAGRTCS